MNNWKNFVFLFLMVIIVIHIIYDHMEIKINDIVNLNKHTIREKFTSSLSTKHTPIKETSSKETSSKETSSNETSTNKTLINKTLINKTPKDNTVHRYSQNYLINQSLTKYDASKFTYVPYNYEDTSDKYGTLTANNDNAVDDEMSIDTDGDDGFDMFRIQDVRGLKHYKKFADNIVNDLPPRHTWCPDFKCQRNYMTCTSKHVPKIQKKWKPDPIIKVLDKSEPSWNFNQ